MSAQPPAYILDPNVVVRSAEDLRSDIRGQLDLQPGDHIVTNPSARVRSLLVDEDAARVVSSWRQAATVDDVVTWAAEAGLGIDRLDVEELRSRLVSVGYLLSTGAGSSNADRLEAGARLGGIVVDRLAHEMPDKAVYLGAHAGGGRVAIKLAASASDHFTRGAIEREARLLEALRLDAVPVLIESGALDGRAFVAMEWRDGVDALTWANDMRSAAGSPEAWAGGIRDLVATIFEAYASLHEAGIVHGDIHPRNILVRDDGAVSIIDFELALTPSAGENPTVPRGGVPYFFEAEYAEALLQGRHPPSASFESDVHGLLALAYLLFTGRHYLPFRFERRQFYRQISAGGMQPFASAVGWTWPAMEEILATGLKSGGLGARDLAARMRRAALEEVSSAPPPALWPADFLATFHRGGMNDSWPLPAPAGSMHHGAAGVAFALLSDAGADAATLADAAMWSHRSLLAIDERDLTAGGLVGAELVRPWSLHYGAAGVQLVRALVACARGAGPELDRAVASFVHCADGMGSPSVDLASGAAGWLLGAALLYEAIPGAVSIPARSLLVERGDSVLTALATDDLDSLPVGIAHGVAGVAYAAFQWSRARRSSPPTWAVAIAEDLGRRQGEAQNAGWIAPVEWEAARALRFASSWCNGSSGLALLFCAAYESTQRGDFLLLAADAGEAAAEAGPNGASLCCGDAGRAFSFAAIGRMTGEDRWFVRAKETSMAAATGRQTMPASLYKGALGARFAERALRDPRRARFPLFELAGWPARWTHAAASEAGDR